MPDLIRHPVLSWIPGRASLARNDDFLLLSRVLQEAHLTVAFTRFVAVLLSMTRPLLFAGSSNFSRQKYPYDDFGAGNITAGSSG
jgi:hypothetical protein